MSAQKRYAIWVLLCAGCCIFALSMGSRQSMGLFVSPLNSATHLGYVSISLAFAFGQLWWGLTQPFAGAVADKLGAGRVLLTGLLMIALGMFLTPWMTTTVGLIFTVGVLGAGGAGLAGPAVIMATVSRMLPPERRGMASGILNAGGSFGQFIMAPIAGALIISLGWDYALKVLGLLVLLGLPAILFLRGNGAEPSTAGVAQGASTQQAPAPEKLSTGAAISQAFALPSYWMLNAGFFVCGFHVAFLATHLPDVIAMCGLPTQYGAWSLAIIGLFNIAGSIGMGWAVSHWRMKSLLSLVYGLRGLAVICFLFAPKTGPVILLFAAVMGLTYLSTVPPTVGLVAKFFGPANMAMLYGIVLLAHQIGAFLGAWLGGKIRQTTGSYDWMWYLDIMLALGAALVHLPIKEQPLVRRMLNA